MEAKSEKVVQMTCLHYVYTIVRYYICTKTAASASTGCPKLSHGITANNHVHDLMIPTAKGPPISSRHLEHMVGLIRIGFLTGNAISLMQDWDLHPWVQVSKLSFRSFQERSHQRDAHVVC